MTVISAVKTENWSTLVHDHPSSFSVTVTSDLSLAVVSICQASGFGLVLDASSDGVVRMVGARGDGIEEAFARALTSQIGVKRVILTLALRESSPQMFRGLLLEFKKFQ